MQSYTAKWYKGYAHDNKQYNIIRIIIRVWTLPRHKYLRIFKFFAQYIHGTQRICAKILIGLRFITFQRSEIVWQNGPFGAQLNKTNQFIKKKKK